MAQEKNEQKIQYLVRIANTDLNGNKAIAYALTKIKGVSTTLAAAICAVSKVDKTTKAGLLNAEEIARLDKAVRNPLAAGVPVWMANHQKEYETGNDVHLIMGDLDFTQQNDVKRLSKIKSYRGLRHQWKLPLRGQRTKSNFRKSKTKSASAAKKGRKTGPKPGAPAPKTGA